MIREKIIIGDYIYNCEYYETILNKSKDQIYKKFVILRNFKLENNIVLDTDIMFIENDIYEEVKKSYDSKTNNINILSFPLINNKSSYSKNIYEFNDLFNENSIYNEFNEFNDGDDIYRLKDENGQDAYILCDKLKIYHPLLNNSNKYIIHIYNNINGINFHYLCRLADTYKTKAETEININNQIYSEYIEVCIPNLHYLFDKKGIDENNNDIYNVYFYENLGMITSSKNENFIKTQVKNFNDENNDQLIPLSLLIQPFRIIEEKNNITNETISVKQYLKLHKSIINNYLTYPLNLQLYPYEKYDENINLFILDENYDIGSTIFNNELRFTLSNKLGFSNGIFSSITNFNYPLKKIYLENNNNNTNKALLSAYKHFNDVKEEDYIQYSKIYNDIKNKDEEYLYNQNYYKYNLDKVEVQEYEESQGLDIDFIGFQIKIATDLKFKNIIYIKNVKIKLNEIDDFSFNLNNIFDSWDQLNNNLIMIISFYDNYLGISIPGNFVVITKEWFKYMITDNITTLNNIVEENNKFIKNDMKEIKLSNANNYFINNMTCVIQKNDENSNIKDFSKKNSPRILYKPIFYRVNDLQNIKLRSNLIQNIGINLVEYMTKIESFKILIGNKEFYEIGRNDIYVIFKLNANEILNNNGQYDILNQDDEYISTGNFIKY